MPIIRPFRGYRYNPKKVNIHDVVAPPYDVISPEQQTALYEKSPYNVVRLILGREEDRYSSAAGFLKKWISENVLIRERESALYLLHQQFDDHSGKAVVRKGFIALCRLEEFEKKIVLPHEKTLSKPKEDRFKLFQATNANFSQIFSLYTDVEKEIDRILNGTEKSEPLIEVLFEDVHNRLWRITEKSVITRVQEAIKDKQVLIADGHHRYETALAYRDLMRSRNPRHTGDELYNFVMMFFTNIEDEGLIIYPTHRLVHSLPSFDPKEFLRRVEDLFIIRDFREKEDMVIALQSSPVSSFGVALQGEMFFYLLTIKPSVDLASVLPSETPPEIRKLDVTLLHSLLLDKVLGISPAAQEQKTSLDYVRKAEEAFAAVDARRAQLAFIMNPTRIEQVRQVARAGHTMPQKSTYFYPKLVSGLVINKMDED
ncbi:MAG TPA: DUF1015 domain-containing protein [Bacteroidota bacterium]|nr:DUF1015 domain-containing protein [Bacteroidota bacterium]